MQKPLVSVIVPIYNAQNNIVRCVESIRRQTYENLEILLLNDGSKDVSYPVCEMLSKADARIVLIDKENSGVSGDAEPRHAHGAGQTFAVCGRGRHTGAVCDRAPRSACGG